ncbi:MAG: Calx-beta domain-containing protein [Isosphaeraceae bacterium]
MELADVSVTNLDDDTAGVTVTPTSGLTTTEAGGTASFTVVLDSQPTANVTIGVSSSDTTEGTAAPASLTFTPANWNIPQTVTVTGVDDFVDDGDVAYSIVTAAATSTDANYNGLNPADVAATNLDDDTAGITVSPTSGLVTTEAGGTATFTVVLDSQPTANVTIALSSSNTAEGTVSPISLTFTAANWDTPQTVTVTGVDDAVDDGDIAFTIVTAAATSPDAKYNGLNPADVSVTNEDNDTAGITATPSSGLVTTEAGGTATFTVVLNSQPTANVTVALSSSNTAEGTVGPASLTFTAANWNTPQTVTVTGVDDSVSDGEVEYSILGAVTSTDANYGGLGLQVDAVNQDNDTPGITVSPTAGLTTTEAGGAASFTVVLNTQPTGDVTIPLSSDDTSEGTIGVSSLTFTPENWDVPQTVTVTGVDDFVVDGDVAYSIVAGPATSADPNYNGFDADDVSVTNLDDDTAGVTVSPTSGLTTTEAGGTASFTVVLNSQPVGNVSTRLSSREHGRGCQSGLGRLHTGELERPADRDRHRR